MLSKSDIDLPSMTGGSKHSWGEGRAGTMLWRSDIDPPSMTGDSKHRREKGGRAQCYQEAISILHQ
jgi:hypothetical protein